MAYLTTSAVTKTQSDGTPGQSFYGRKFITSDGGACDWIAGWQSRENRPYELSGVWTGIQHTSRIMVHLAAPTWSSKREAADGSDYSSMTAGEYIAGIDERGWKFDLIASETGMGVLTNFDVIGYLSDLDDWAIGDPTSSGYYDDGWYELFCQEGGEYVGSFYDWVGMQGWEADVVAAHQEWVFDP